MFPITITKLSGRAASRGAATGGKDYHLVLIETAGGRAITIFRWAKANQWGNGWQLDRYETVAQARSAFLGKKHEKILRAYSKILVDKPDVRVTNPRELNRELGQQYWAKIGPDNLKWLSPEINTNGMRRGAENTEYFTDKDGNVRIKPPDILPIRRASAEPTLDDHIASNPNWGTWG